MSNNVSRQILVLFPFLVGFACPLPAAAQARVSETYGKLPLHFEANRGQTHEDVRFLARGAGYSLYLTAGEAVLVLAKPSSDAKRDLRSTPEQLSTQARETPVVVRMSLVGAAPEPAVNGLDELPGKANYLIGRDPAKWRTNVPTYAKVQYRAVYPGIDLLYYGNQRQLEYDFVVAPGADPKTIALGFKGVERLEIDPQGELLLHAPGGTLRQRKPVIYQEIDGVRTKIEGGYVLKGPNRVAFQVARYDISRPLLIDPVLVYSTYLGGSGDDGGFGIAVDAAGAAYVTGTTTSINFTAGCTFPCTVFDATRSGSRDAFVTKLNAAGTALVYSTYLGGSGSETGLGIAVDTAGNAYVTGVTDSTNFPTTVGAFQGTFGGGSTDAFVAKLNASGSGLVYSTYLGGNSLDSGNGIAVDAAGAAYVTGATQSTNFTAGCTAPCVVLKGTRGGLSDAFVTKLNATGTALVYSTYLGGTTPFPGPVDTVNAGFGIAVDAAGAAYVTGTTNSDDFTASCTTPCTVLKGSHRSLTWSVFVTKLNATGTALVYSTYVGGSDLDFGYAITVDPSGAAYVTGITQSADFTDGCLAPCVVLFSGSRHASGFGPRLSAQDAFVTKLNATGTALVYSTYLGGIGNDRGFGIAVDSAGAAYVTGFTQSPDFAADCTPPCTVLYGTLRGWQDAFVTKLNPTGTALVYFTYLGGSGSFEEGRGIAVDGPGAAYVTGFTDSADFPTTPGAFRTTSNGNADAFVAKIGSSPAGYEIVSRRVLVPASNIANVNVSCSGGNKVMGGGFSIETPTFVKVFASEPTNGASTFSDHQWNVLAQNTDPNNARQVTVVAVCASATLLVGHELRSQQIFVPASSSSNVTAACSIANKVLGGGFDIETPAFVKVLSTEPSDGAGNVSDHSWNVLAQNTDPNNSRQTTASAVCASALVLPGHEVVSQQASLAPSSTANVNVSCSSGKKVLGGGFRIDSTVVQVFSSTPSDGLSNLNDHRWNVAAQNTDPNNARQVTVSAICAQF
jgi:hypothetical protein